MQLSPQKEFVIVWNGADPADTDTLYVQATVRDAHTLALLNTVNLTDQGNHLFSKAFITPRDNSQAQGGRQILITITVYVDSGYTTTSQNYARETNHYIVQERIDPAKFYGVSGGEFDYKAFKKMIEGIIEDKMPMTNAPVVLKQEFPIAAIVKAMKTEIGGIHIPEYEMPEAVDLSSIESGLIKVMQQIGALPKPKDTDLKPVLQEIKGVSPAIKEMIADLSKNILGMMEKSFSKTSSDIVSKMTAEVVKEISRQIKEGELKVSLFGNGGPMDTTEIKKKAFQDGVKRRLGIK